MSYNTEQERTINEKQAWCCYYRMKKAKEDSENLNDCKLDFLLSLINEDDIPLNKFYIYQGIKEERQFDKNSEELRERLTPDENGHHRGANGVRMINIGGDGRVINPDIESAERGRVKREKKVLRLLRRIYRRRQ